MGLTLTAPLVRYSGRHRCTICSVVINLKIQFEAIDDAAHTYRINLLESGRWGGIRRRFPAVRTLFLTDIHTIDPRSPQLVRMHATAIVLHLRGAGDYVDQMLQDMEEPPLTHTAELN